MSQYTWTNPGSYWSDRQPRSWTQAPNPNLFGGGVAPFTQTDWPNPILRPWSAAASGFLTYIDPHPPWTVWNPSDKSVNVTLSVGNTKATVGAAANSGVRTTASRSAGKWYWEVTPSVIGSAAFLPIGVADASWNLSTTRLGFTTSAGYAAGGVVTIVGSAVATLASYGVGDVVGIALDCDNSRIWFRVNGGVWNGSASNDPATNTGGYDISGLATARFAAVSGANINDAVTANFGASLYSGAATMPNSFLGFDGQAGSFTVSVAQPQFLPATDLPRGYPFPSVLRTLTQSLNPNLSGGGIAPFAQTDWPNPRGYVPASTLRTHTDATRLQLIGQDTIYGAPGQGVPNYDWPVPKGPRAAIDLRSWAQNLLQSTLVPLPPPQFLPADPVPRGYVFPVSLRTHLDQTRIQLIGQDRIYGGPGQVPTYDWTNPQRGRIPPIANRTHTDQYKLELIGQDRIYGGPGQGVPNYDWPVPKGYRYPTSLRTWTQDILQSTGQPPAPAHQTDWPNPRGYPYPVSLRSLVNPTITMRNAVTWTPIDDPATPTWTTIADPATPQWTEVPEN